MRLDGSKHLQLLLVVERAELMRDTGGQGPRAQQLSGCLREPLRHLRPLSNPISRLAEHACDVHFREPIARLEGLDHRDLVERRDRLVQGVRVQQQPLVLHGVRDRLHHDGDDLEALLFPRCEALEAVDHLVRPILDRHDPKGHGRQGRRATARPGTSRAQSRV